MEIIDKSQARGISKRIIRELFEALDPDNNKVPQIELMNLSPKKRARTIIKLCRMKSSHFILLEELHSEKSRWEILFGEWSLGYRGRERPAKKKDYDRLLFDLCYSRKFSVHQKFFYIVVSKHALIRMIMRSGEHLTSIEDVYQFLSKLTRDAILAGMSMLEGNRGTILHSNGFYLPLVHEKGMNLYGKGAISIVIKTVMPEWYVINEMELLNREEFRSTLFELPECLGANNHRFMH